MCHSKFTENFDRLSEDAVNPPLLLNEGVTVIDPTVCLSHARGSRTVRITAVVTIEH